MGKKIRKPIKNLPLAVEAVAVLVAAVGPIMCAYS